MEFKIRESEYRLLSIIWNNEPLSSRELTVKAEEELGWKRTTTYTVLKALIEYGLCQNDNATVTALVKRDEFERKDSERVAEYIRGRFSGSLPQFLTAFIDENGMSDEEADEIMRILQEFKGE